MPCRKWLVEEIPLSTLVLALQQTPLRRSDVSVDADVVYAMLMVSRNANVSRNVHGILIAGAFGCSCCIK